MPSSLRRLSICVLAALAGGSGSCRQQPATPEAAPAPITTASGLELTEIRAGAGDVMAPGDLVVISYVARRDDGEVFDDRTDRSEVIRMPVGRSNPIFWEEALQRMRVGGRYRIHVPAAQLWPQALRPEWLRDDGHAVYEVDVHRVVRAPKLIKPQPGLTEEGEGFTYQILDAGDTAAPLPKPTDWVEVGFTAWDEHGNVVDSSRPLETPLRFQVADPPSPFFGRAVPAMHPGATWTCVVPAAIAWRQRHGVLAPEDRTWWMVELLSVTPQLPLPAFVPPDDAELSTTESGLQYRILKPGSGPAPTAASTVDVHYVGWRSDGTVIDSSYAYGRPTRLAVAGLIRGWREGLLLLREGGAALLAIPPELAYGAEGLAAKQIEPDADLVFRVELVKIVR